MTKTCKSTISNPKCQTWLSQWNITKTSLLHRLQTETLSDATPSIGKIHPFSKIAMRFGCPFRFRIVKKFEQSKYTLRPLLEWYIVNKIITYPFIDFTYWKCFFIMIGFVLRRLVYSLIRSNDGFTYFLTYCICKAFKSYKK